MADIAHCVPAIVTVQEGSEFGFTRPGMQQTAFISGRYLSRDWHGYDVREYSLDFTRLVSSTTALEQWSAFWHHIDGGNSEGYLVEPISATHRELICGGLGDGSKTTFPIPVKTPTSVTVFVDGVPQASTAYTVHSVANGLSADEFAAPNDADDFTFANGTDSVVAGLSVTGLSCLKIVPTGTGTDTNGRPTPTSGLSASPGDVMTAVVAVLETMSSARSFEPTIRWYDSGGSSLSADSATASSASAGVWTIYSHSATAPASTARAAPEIRETNDDADPWYVGAFAICPGDYDRWHLPSQAPGLVEFATAPASGARVTATATGQRIARCRFEPGSRWSMTSPGDAVLRSVRAIEVVEF